MERSAFTNTSDLALPPGCSYQGRPLLQAFTSPPRVAPPTQVPKLWRHPWFFPFLHPSDGSGLLSALPPNTQNLSCAPSRPSPVSSPATLWLAVFHRPVMENGSSPTAAGPTRALPGRAGGCRPELPRLRCRPGAALRGTAFMDRGLT